MKSGDSSANDRGVAYDHALASNPQITAGAHKAKPMGDLLHENALQACQRTHSKLIRSWKFLDPNFQNPTRPKGISLFQASPMLPCVPSQHIVPGSPTPTALLGGGASIQGHRGMAQKCQEFPLLLRSSRGPTGTSNKFKHFDK